jgi:hypothetical protein
MRGSTRWAIAVIATSAWAVGAPGMAQTMPSQDQMIKVGECMANVDAAAMEAMERKSDAFEAELKRLCKAGMRDAALQHARQYGLEMANDPAMKQIKACTAGMPMPQQRTVVPQEKLTPADICSH